jgi:branched-chain amino acid transport system ATP-binding protein
MLEVRSLSKRFGGLDAVQAVNIDVEVGEIVSLIGPNGAGKTTVFAIISGFLTPDSGQIIFEGTDITGRRPHEICRRGVVRTFQIVQPFANLTVRDNIAIGAHTHIGARAGARTKADEIASQLGMTDMLDQRAGALTISGRKRLELARALATAPKLMLLDEVMAGLNATEVDEIVGLVRDIRASGVTIFVIEHVMQAVMKLSDRTYVLNEGKLIADGAPDRIASDPAVIEAYLGHGAAARIVGKSGHA